MIILDDRVRDGQLMGVTRTTRLVTKQRDDQCALGKVIRDELAQQLRGQQVPAEESLPPQHPSVGILTDSAHLGGIYCLASMKKLEIAGLFTKCFTE